MNQINAIIDLDPTRLNYPRRTIYALRYHSIVAEFTNVPDDVTSMTMRIFKADLTNYFEVPVSRRLNGGAKAYIIGTCFPAAGSAKYELHAYDAKGNMTALGYGSVLVEDFTQSSAPITPGASVPISQVADSSGVMHTISVVSDGVGGYTTIIED